MSSPGTEDRTYILRVNIQDGKSFGPDLQAITCAATFAGETKLTPYSVGRETHVWNTTLQWRVTMDQFRRLTSLGQKDCKVVLTNKEGTKLGWFLVDVRSAKLQAQYKKTEGAWVSLTGAKKGDVPQVCMMALFYEDRPGVSFSPETKQSPNKSRAARRQQAVSRSLAAAGGEAAGQEPGADFPGGSAGAEEGPDGGRGMDAADVQHGMAVAAVPPARNPTAGLPNFGSPQKNPADDGPFRHFALTVDVRTFQSSRRLPLSSASVYVQAVLPAELIELVVSSGFRLPSRLAPLCSHPSVDIPRGAEGAVPNGYGTVEFSAGVVQLARVLAREPRISVEAWHKERFRTDMLLGAGSVPLTPLLQGAWVDGYAPLFAVVATSIGGELREERVQMGMLRVVLSLEDKGPAAPSGGQPAAAQALGPAPGTAADGSVAAAAAAPPAMPVLTPRPNPYDQEAAAAIAEAAQADPSGDGALPPQVDMQIREIVPPPPTDPGAASAAAAPLASAPERSLAPQKHQQQVLLPPPAHSAAPPPVLSLPSPAKLAAGRGPGRLQGLLPPGLQGAPEFEAAWELEVWKKAEEARWRSELREREAQRMLVLESEWRRRERAREAEIASLKAEYLALEDKAQQVLSAAEGRERRILAAEEALLRRRKELEREHSARMVEAEAAVRRLQVECEHQLDIERDRNAELVRRVAMLEERLAATEMRCLTVENEFADFRAATRSTPEAELARQLAEAREAAKAAEARAAKAAKAKQGYKEQVRKLAEQLAGLQRRRHRDDDGASFRVAGIALPAAGPAPAAMTTTIRAVAAEEARHTASQQQELATMRAQLAAIKAAALAELSPPGSPRGDAGAFPGLGALPGAASQQPDGADEQADLRSVDQQRSGRPNPRAGNGNAAAAGVHAARPGPGAAGLPPPLGPLAYDGGGASSAGQGRGPGVASASAGAPPPGSGPREQLEPDATPVHPAAPRMQPGTSSSAESISSTGSSGRQAQGHSGGTSAGPGGPQGPAAGGGGGAAAAAAAGGGGVWGLRRWAAPRPAASDPTALAGWLRPGGEDWQEPSPAVSAPAGPVPGRGPAPYGEGDDNNGRRPAPQQHPQQYAQQRHAISVQTDEQEEDIALNDDRPQRHDMGTDAAIFGQRPGSQPAGGDRSRWDGEGRGAQRPARRAGWQVGGRDAAHLQGGKEEPRRSLADHLASASGGARVHEREVAPQPVGSAGPSIGVSAGRGAGWLGDRTGDVQQSGEAVGVSAGSGGRQAGGGAASSRSGPGVEGPEGSGQRGGLGQQPQRRSVAVQHVSEVQPPPTEDPFASNGESGGAGDINADLSEIQRLIGRKAELLKRDFNVEDTVVQLLDERIRALLAATAGLPVS